MKYKVTNFFVKSIEHGLTCLHDVKSEISKTSLYLCREMVETIIKGFVIGLLVSLPMGPINLIAIQRTLNRGRWHGFVSGLGAVLSDIIYATITLLALNLVSSFLKEYESLLLIAGSGILVLFGVAVYNSNPLKGWQPDKLPKESRYIKDFISAFLLTFSNVAIILALIGLYTRFSFNPMMEGRVSTLVGLVSFTSAAILWWFLLTTFVSKLRSHFNRKGLIILNRIIGCVFIIIGFGGVFHSAFPNLLRF